MVDEVRRKISEKGVRSFMMMMIWRVAFVLYSVVLGEFCGQTSSTWIGYVFIFSSRMSFGPYQYP